MTGTNIRMNLSDFSSGDLVAIIVGVLSLIVSIIVLFITYKTWNLKSGQSVRAEYGITSSIAADGPYISKVIIENLKDKELIIFGIYIRFGRNIFIDLLDIDDHYDKYYHILPPLSTRIFELGAPLYYHCSAREVDVESLLRDNKLKGDIILLTNIGKIKAKHFKKGWSPISQYFRNYATIYIRPTRFYTKDSCPLTRTQGEHFIDYSSIEKTSKYLVTIKFKNDKVQDFIISESYKYVIFQALTFTSEILNSKESLQKYFYDARNNDLISFEEIVDIKDIQDIVTKDKSHLLTDKIETIDKEDIQNWFQYWVISQIETWIYKIKNPNFPSFLFSLYCYLGIRKNPNKRKHNN